jgi:hypothetical protein
MNDIEVHVPHKSFYLYNDCILFTQWSVLCIQSFLETPYTLGKHHKFKRDDYSKSFTVFVFPLLSVLAFGPGG